MQELLSNFILAELLSQSLIMRKCISSWKRKHKKGKDNLGLFQPKVHVYFGFTQRFTRFLTSVFTGLYVFFLWFFFFHSQQISSSSPSTRCRDQHVAVIKFTHVHTFDRSVAVAPTCRLRWLVVMLRQNQERMY